MKFAGAAAFVLCAVLPSRAIATPADGYALSDDAALMGGVAIATGRDTASGWYNPALLAANRRTRADVSATAYGIRWIKAPRGVEERVDGRTRTHALRNRELLVVPTAFAAATSIRNRVSIGLAFFTTHWGESTIAFRSSGRSQRHGYRYSEDVRAEFIRKRYHAGPMLGWKVTDGFEIGFSILGLYDKDSVSVRTFVDAEDDASPAAATQFLERASVIRSFGGGLALGLRGRLSRLVRAGAVLRTPGVVVVQRIEDVQNSIAISTDERGETTAERDLNTLPARRRPVFVSNWQVGFGIGVGRSRWHVGADAVASPALRPSTPEIGRAAVWNVRVGGRVRVAPKWTIGGGTFTDRNTLLRSSLGVTRINMWGGSFGVQFRSPVRLARRERARRLAFRTTVAVRYAGGRGKSGGLVVDYPDGPPTSVAVAGVESTRASMHLLTVHLGSGLVF